MKIKMFLIIPIFILASSCNSGPHYPPTGVWKSEAPDIVLYIVPEYLFYKHPYNHLGIYTTSSGEEIKVFTRFLIRVAVFGIYEITGLREDGAINSDKVLFGGNFRVVDDQLYLSSNSEYIIFNKITDYEPINPNDWFPSEY